MVEQQAQAKNLGTCKQSFRESPILGEVLGHIIGGIVTMGLCIVLFLSSYNTPDITFKIVGSIFSPVGFFWGMYLIWSGIKKTSDHRWLYLYNNGFVYDNQGDIQAYHWAEILSVEMHQYSSGSKDSVTINTYYVVNLDANRGSIWITHGSQVKYRVELYQRQLLNQLRQQLGGPGQQTP